MNEDKYDGPAELTEWNECKLDSRGGEKEESFIKIKFMDKKKNYLLFLEMKLTIGQLWSKKEKRFWMQKKNKRKANVTVRGNLWVNRRTRPGKQVREREREREREKTEKLTKSETRIEILIIKSRLCVPKLLPKLCDERKTRAHREQQNAQGAFKWNPAIYGF